MDIKDIVICVLFLLFVLNTFVIWQDGKRIKELEKEVGRIVK